MTKELKDVTLNDLTPQAHIDWADGKSYFGHRDCDIRDWAIAKVKEINKNREDLGIIVQYLDYSYLSIIEWIVKNFNLKEEDLK